MKKIWKIRKNSEAVSPVIATILMVAITVVLAAVLYVMVMGFNTGTNNTPTGAFTGTPASVTGGYKMSFGAFSQDVKFVDSKVVLTVGGVAQAAQAMTAPPSVNTFTANSLTNTITWTDLGADGKISVGDSLILGGTTAGALASGVTYTVTLLYASTGGQMCAQSVTVP